MCETIEIILSKLVSVSRPQKSIAAPHTAMIAPMISMGRTLLPKSMWDGQMIKTGVSDMRVWATPALVMLTASRDRLTPKYGPSSTAPMVDMAARLLWQGRSNL